MTTVPVRKGSGTFSDRRAACDLSVGYSISASRDAVPWPEWVDSRYRTPTAAEVILVGGRRTMIDARGERVSCVEAVKGRTLRLPIILRMKWLQLLTCGFEKLDDDGGGRSKNRCSVEVTSLGQRSRQRVTP